ncbi:MAG: hypothetical protein F7B06_06485 [Opitutae bacterium]|nr:hypothetical protein [Opitutae bacterium]
MGTDGARRGRELEIIINNASLDPAAPEQDRFAKRIFFSFILLEHSSILLPQASSEALLNYKLFLCLLWLFFLSVQIRAHPWLKTLLD